MANLIPFNRDQAFLLPPDLSSTLANSDGYQLAGQRSGWDVKLARPRQETSPCSACHPASPRLS